MLAFMKTLFASFHAQLAAQKEGAVQTVKHEVDVAASPIKSEMQQTKGRLETQAATIFRLCRPHVMM
eukprot:7657676-Pyramimonas_sp.AAC.1